jgi:hypothetical protein
MVFKNLGITFDTVPVHRCKAIHRKPEEEHEELIAHRFVRGTHRHYYELRNKDGLEQKKAPYLGAFIKSSSSGLSHSARIIPWLLLNSITPLFTLNE